MVFQLPFDSPNNTVDVANAKPYPLSLPHAVNNAHLITWTPYAKFQPVWSINEFLVGMMMSYGCGYDQTTPIDTDVINNAHLVAWKPHSIFQSGCLFDSLLISKTTSSGCGYSQTKPTCG